MSGIPFWDTKTRGYEGPDYSPHPWEKCKLADIPVPGIVVVKCTPKEKIQITKVHGVDGGPTIQRGREAVKVEIMIRLWTPRQWELYQEMKDAIWRQPGKPSRLDDPKSRALPDFVSRVLKQNGVSIDCPACKDANITAIAIESIGTPVPTGTPGEMSIAVAAVQFIAPNATGATRKLKGPTAKRVKEWSPANQSVDKPSMSEAVPDLLMSPASGGFSSP